MRLAEILNEQGVSQGEFAKRVDIERRLFNKIVTYKVLPTPPDMERILSACAQGLYDVYTPAEVRFPINGKDAPQRENKAPVYKLTVRIDRTFFGDPDEFQKRLRATGYPSITAWICACKKRLDAEYAARQKKTAPRAAHEKIVTTILSEREAVVNADHAGTKRSDL